MTLLNKLKDLLGLDDTRTSTEDRDVGVTVEREGPSAGDDGGTGAGAGAGAGDDVGDGTGDGDVVAAGEAGTEANGGAVHDDAGAQATSEAQASDEGPPDKAVDVIKGIGPTYADRLENAGIETVADLAAADAESVADSADVPRGRLDEWIERAKSRTR